MLNKIEEVRRRTETYEQYYLYNPIPYAPTAMESITEMLFDLHTLLLEISRLCEALEEIKNLHPEGAGKITDLEPLANAYNEAHVIAKLALKYNE